MKTISIISFVATTLASTSLMAAAPVVSDVVMTQRGGGGRVQVDYRLDIPAVITLDVQTNVDANAAADATEGWVSIGDIHLRTASGDVNKIVTTATGCIYWHPEKDWPDGGELPNVRAVVTAWATNSPPNYLVADLVEPYNVRFYTSPEAFPEGNCTSRVYKTDKLVMRRVPAAGVEWQMGSLAGEYGRENSFVGSKETRHAVTLNEDFYIGIYPVTKCQFYRFYGWSFSSDALDAARQFCGGTYSSYNTIRGSTGDGVDWPNTSIYTVGSSSTLKTIRNKLKFTFDIPTEAQWEYACRAGTGTSLNIGASPSDTSSPTLAQYRQIVGHARNVTDVDVGTTTPNAWGIYDMHGTIARTWCRDWFVDDLGSGDDSAGNGPASGTTRVLRGPSYNSYDVEIRSANRYKGGRAPDKTNTADATNDIGYRLWLPVTLY